MTKQRLVKQFCTAHDTAYRLSELAPIAFEPATNFSDPSVFIDTTVKFQEIQGFGGAFTEAAAVTLDKMPSPLAARNSGKPISLQTPAMPIAYAEPTSIAAISRWEIMPIRKWTAM